MADRARRHHFSRVFAQVFPLVAAAVLLASCGGSSSDDAPSPTPTPAPSPVPSPTPEPPAPPAPLDIRYVALGDSAGFGVGALPGDGGYPPRLARMLREAGHDVDIANLSVPGATARDLADAQLPLVGLYSPTLVTVCVGGNDVGADRTPEEFGADVDRMLSQLAPIGAAIVLCNVPDVSLTPRYGGDPEAAALVVALNAELARVAAARGVPVADIYTVTRERLFDEPDLLSPDGFHPSAAGYEVWAETMLPVVKAALGVP